MNSRTFLIAFFFLLELPLNAQFYNVDMTKPTDTLFFGMDATTEDITIPVNFKLSKGNKFQFGQVTMKAHQMNPFKLPKIFLNNKAMYVGLNFPKLNQDAVFTFYNPDDTSTFDIKSPFGNNAAELNFVFSKKDLLEGDNEIKISVSDKDEQNGLAITDLKLYLRAPLNSDNVILQRLPVFPGGQKAWQSFLKENMDTDVPVRNGAPTGRYIVLVSFIVDKEGNLSELKAENDPGFGTKEEALKIIKRRSIFI